MEYILEIWYKGEAIEQRRRAEPWIEPLAGERFYVEFQNRFYAEEYGSWWIVRHRKHLLFGADQRLQTLQLYCEPDPARGGE